MISMLLSSSVIYEPAIFLCLLVGLAVLIPIGVSIYRSGAAAAERQRKEMERRKKAEEDQKYKAFESEVLRDLGFSSWGVISYFDESVFVKSRQALEKYDAVKFFKEKAKN